MDANAVRRSPCAGLPLLATEPLTAVERSALETLALAYVHLQARLEEALRRGTVCAGLDAVAAIAELGRLADQTTPLLGRGR